MTHEEITRLLASSEGISVDFKAQIYGLPEARNDLIKDLLSMANTPRDRDAYIVCGVRWTPEDGSQVIGLDTQYDDVRFQDALGDGRVQPRLSFTYLPVEYQGKQLGIFQIPVGKDGPYTAIKDYEGLQAGAIYFRRGSKNDRASGTELRKICAWFMDKATPEPAEPAHSSWPRFLDLVQRFSPRNKFLLAADRIDPDTRAPVHALSIVPWRAVLDFDPASDQSGLLSMVGKALGAHNVLHRITRGEYHVSPEPGIHWFFAQGLTGKQDSLVDGDHRAWLKAYKTELGRQLERIAGAVNPVPVFAVVAWSDAGLRKHLRTLVEELHGAFGDLVTIAVVSDDAASFEGLCEECGAAFVAMSLRTLCLGILDHFSDEGDTGSERSLLPTIEGAPVEVRAEDRLWLSENLEMLYHGCGLDGEDSACAFRQGGEVTWRNLHLQQDCEREVTLSLRSQVERDLSSRHAVRNNLYHIPGAGGTTVGRRVLWDLHIRFPTAILRACEPRDTAERISKVSALTQSSVLILVDGGEHSERDIDDLFDYIKANQTPCVILQVLRRFQKHSTGKRQFWLDSDLSDLEADRFCAQYSQDVPDRHSALAHLARQGGGRQRNAFFFGLTAYGKEYQGLQPYVSRRTSALTDLQTRIVVYLAIAHYYGQQTVPAQAFAPMLSLPRTRLVDLHCVFGGGAESVLELMVESDKAEWRTVHSLIALEILQQLLAPKGSREPERVWRQSISSWAKEFASFCRGEDQTKSDRLLELVRRVFIYRDNVELLGTEHSRQQRFAQLVEEIPSNHGKIDVLRHLTQQFPLEAHFHGHLGRLLGLVGNYDEAIESVNMAIDLQPQDHVLHHVKGMILRYAIRSANSDIASILPLAKDAAASFEESRLLAPDLEHGYISEVQMLTEVLDKVSSRRGGPALTEILARSDTDPFLRGSLERAEDLMDRAQRLFAGEGQSQYVLDCRARLERLYGDFSKSLQAWDNLLARPEVPKPAVRRQIVWTILRRHGGAWEKLGDKEIGRASDLLHQNMQEELNDSTSLRLWLRAIRHISSPPSLDVVIEKVSYWKANTSSLDAAYYLYVLHALRALQGSGQALADSERALEECRAIARFRRDRTRSFEWIGLGEDIRRLVHQSRLGEWKDDFWMSTEAITRLPGRVASIEAPQKGLIELEGGLPAFFVPVKGDFHRGRDENTPVNCFVGFSYDGIRAWDVRRHEA